MSFFNETLFTILASAINPYNDKTLAVVFFSKSTKKIGVASGNLVVSESSGTVRFPSDQPEQQMKILAVEQDNDAPTACSITPTSSSLVWINETTIATTATCQEAAQCILINTSTGKTLSTLSLSPSAKLQAHCETFLVAASISFLSPDFSLASSASSPSINANNNNNNVEANNGFGFPIFGMGHGENFGIFDVSSPAQASLLLESRAMRSTSASKLTCGAFLASSFLASSTSGNKASQGTANNNSSNNSNPANNEASRTIQAVFGTRTGMELLCFEAKITLGAKITCRGGGFINTSTNSLMSGGGSGLFQNASSGVGTNHHCGSALLISCHSLDPSLVALGHRNGAVALFDVNNYSYNQPLFVIHVSTSQSSLQTSSSSSLLSSNRTCFANNHLCCLFWHHSPADLLTVVTTNGVEIYSPFATSKKKRSSPVSLVNLMANGNNNNKSLSVFSSASPLFWTAYPSVLCFVTTSSPVAAFVNTNSPSILKLYQVTEPILDSFAPRKLLSLKPFLPSMSEDDNSNGSTSKNSNTDTSCLFLMNNNSNSEDVGNNDDYDGFSDDDDDVLVDGNEASPFAFTLQQAAVNAATSSSTRHHHHGRSHSRTLSQFAAFRYDQKEMENSEKLLKALKLSYKRKLSDARQLTLSLLNSMLDSKEKLGAASAYSTDSVLQRRVDDVIALALARRDNSASSSSVSSTFQDFIKQQYCHNIDLLRFRAMKFATARLNQLSLIPPQCFLAVSPSVVRIVTATQMQPSQTKINFFENFLQTSSAIEAQLATLSVRLTIANYVDSANCSQIVAHKHLLARALKEGSISTQLTQRVFKLLLSQSSRMTDYIKDVVWILENSVLMAEGLPTTPSLAPKQNVLADDDVDDEIKEIGNDTKKEDKSNDRKSKKDKKKEKKNKKKKHGDDEDEEDEEDDEEEDEDDETSSSSSDDDDDSIQELSNSVSVMTAAPANTNSANFFQMYPMLSSAAAANHNSNNSPRRLVFAILEILFYPLACDADNDDIGIPEFFESGANSFFAPSASSLFAATSQISSSTTPTVRKRDKRSARDARRCLKIFIRDCAISSIQHRDPFLFSRILHLVLKLRDLEMNQWRSKLNSVQQQLMGNNGNNSVDTTPAQECMKLFVDFEQQSSGRGLSVIPSRYVSSRYIYSLKSCQKDAALLWMTSQLGSVHQSKQCSRPLAIWMNEFAEQHVTEVCDLGDVIGEHIEKFFDILEKFSSSSASANANNTSAIEKDLLRISNDMHRKMVRLINCVYQGEAIFQRIPTLGAASPTTTNNSNVSEGTLNQMQSARGFMGEVLDKIGDTMTDSLGGWGQLLTEIKQMNQLLQASATNSNNAKMSKTDQNMKYIAGLVTNALANSLKNILIVAMNKLPASLGESVIDDSYQNIISTVEEFLNSAH